MKKRMNNIYKIILLILCIGISSFGASGRKVQASWAKSGAMRHYLRKNADMPKPDAGEENHFSVKQMKENEEWFLEEAESQGVEAEQAEELFERLLEDDVFQNGAMKLTGLRLDDMDGNGRTDMLVMVQDAEEIVFYGSGGLWLYMNEDAPYCFEEEACSYYGIFDVFWADVDNDENAEIVFSAEGFGCGAVGDSYKAIFKYRNNTIERMELPSDLDVDYDQGLTVDVIREPEADSYSAYCPYLDEILPFHRKHGGQSPQTAELAGGNARGFYNLSLAEYEGRNVLKASEYLYGEDGVADCAGIAHFFITWEEDGTPAVVKWWLEEESL